VLTLNHKVPIDCTDADHQSILLGCQAKARRRARAVEPGSSISSGVLIASKYCT
jgi:hypothetical protein